MTRCRPRLTDSQNPHTRLHMQISKNINPGSSTVDYSVRADISSQQQLTLTFPHSYP